jgi:hypothetical protein
VAGDFDYVAFCDVSAFGAGGVWFSGTKPLHPAVWRVEFPPDITSQVISDSNPNGVLTNSDLELAGVLLHYLALEQIAGDLQHIRVAIGCDNTPAVAWTTCMATQVLSPIAFRLLRGLAMRQRVTQAAPPETFHTEGERNVLADVASRIVASLSNVTNQLETVALLDACRPGFRPVLQRDLNAAWAAIGVATVDDKQRKTGWADWRRYAVGANSDPPLRGLDKSGQQNLLLAFAARVCTGIYGKGRQVGHQSVKKALHHMAQTLQLGGYDDPRKTYGAKELDLPFRHLLKSYRDSDPAPKPQLALPIPTIQTASSRYKPHHSPRNRAISDLTCMAFFFLLCVGEYTMPSPGTITRTVQFRLKDVCLWQQGTLLNNFAPRAELMAADAVTLYLENQKNGNKGATIHHTAVAGWFCPVKALIRRVSDIASQGLGNKTPLSCISPGSHVTSPLIVSTICKAAQLTRLTTHGYDLKRIGAHLLQASGAMALKLNNVDADTMMKMGRWTSSTFLIYIHSQIAALKAGLAQQMVHPVYFQNVGG